MSVIDSRVDMSCTTLPEQHVNCCVNATRSRQNQARHGSLEVPQWPLTWLLVLIEFSFVLRLAGRLRPLQMIADKYFR